MSYFNQLQYKRIIGVLSILNIVLIALLLMAPTNARKHKKPDLIKLFTKELQLDENQKAQLIKIDQNHREKMTSTKKEWKERKREWIKAISASPVDQDKVDAYTTQIGALQVEIEKTIGQYFIQLKAICKKDQVEKLNELFFKAIHPRRPHKTK